MKWIFAVLVVLLIIGCATKIADIKKPEMVGKSVTVHGTAKNTLKIGTISGFQLDDGNTTILVSTDDLPKDNSNVTVSGILIKDSLFGYYIKAEKIR
jgi:hypothetical protein